MKERINLLKYSHFFMFPSYHNYQLIYANVFRALGLWMWLLFLAYFCMNLYIIHRSLKAVFVICSWSAVTTMFPPYHNYNCVHANDFRASGLWMWLLIGPLMLHVITGYLCNFSFLQVLGPPSKNNISETGLLHRTLAYHVSFCVLNGNGMAKLLVY